MFCSRHSAWGFLRGLQEMSALLYYNRSFLWPVEPLLHWVKRWMRLRAKINNGFTGVIRLLIFWSLLPMCCLLLWIHSICSWKKTSRCGFLFLPHKIIWSFKLGLSIVSEWDLEFRQKHFLLCNVYLKHFSWFLMYILSTNNINVVMLDMQEWM